MKLYLKTKDYFKSKEPFNLLIDEELQLLATDPQPKDLGPYYESDAYISHTDAKTGLISGLYQKVKKYSLKRKTALLNSYQKNNRSLLDIGAGTGDFLVAAKSNGRQIAGTEPNNTARARALEKGIQLKTDVKEFANKEFGAITLWHVLEHLPDLDNQIKSIYKLLHKEGILVVAVPNYKSYDAKYYGEYWAAFDTPRHLWHFSKIAITRIFEKHGFELIKTKPMLFDAFYVSLLSEKYRGGRLQLIKAFLIGSFSNIRALFSGEYSSLIYILKKKNQ